MIICDIILEYFRGLTEPYLTFFKYVLLKIYILIKVGYVYVSMLPTTIELRKINAFQD